MANDSPALRSSVERLARLLEAEPSLKGAELEKAVAEKERLIGELESSLNLGGEGAGQRVAALGESMASLSFASGLNLKLNRIRLQLSRLQKPAAKAESGPRVDLIS